MLLLSTTRRFSSHFGNQSKNFILFCSFIAILIIGVFDYILPYQVSMSIFYTGPIMFAAWYAGRKYGDLIAILALIITWWTDELTAPPEALGWIHAYRMFVRLFFFLAFSMTASAVKARRDLTAAQIELLERSRRLEREIVKISEREQQRIGRDLHDGLCQYLAAISCAAASLKNDLRKNPLQNLLHDETDAAADIAALLKEGVQQARNVARGLCPVYDDESGLDSALQELAAQSSQLMNIECEFDRAARVDIRDNAAAGHLYRITQEALNNATRHGGARHVIFALGENDGLVTLRITDDGKGLPAQAGASPGMGLKIMDYRARLIGGELQVANNPGGDGVTVTCTFRQQAAAVRPVESSSAPAREPGLETAHAA